MTEVMIIIAKCLGAIAVGTIAGNGAVYFFNRIPARWLCDYGQEPDEELLHPTRQRVRSTPWKYVFSGLFIAIGIYLAIDSPLYALAAVASLWLLLEISIADLKYRVIPDQLVLLLMVTATGYFACRDFAGPVDMLIGAALGLGVMLLMSGAGWLIYRRQTIGGGDIKLFAALGLCLGSRGIVIVFVLTTLIAAGHFCLLLLQKKVKPHEKRPMAPYITVSSAIYLVFLHEMSYNILIRL